MATKGIVHRPQERDREAGAPAGRHGKRRMESELFRGADEGAELRSLAAAEPEHLRRLGPDHPTEDSYASRRDAIFRRLLAVSDVAAVVTALVVTASITSVESYSVGVYLGVPFVVLICKMLGLYDRDALVVGSSALAEVPAIFQLATLYTLLLVIMQAGIGSNTTVTATGTFTLWVSLFLVLVAWRLVARTVGRSTTRRERCLVLGNADQALRVGEKFALHRSLHAEIVAHLPYDQFELGRPRDGDFGRYVSARGIDRVIIGQSEAPDRVLETVRYFKEYDLKVSVIPDLLEVVGSSVEFDEIYGTTLLGVRDFELSRSSRLLKRWFDVAGSVALLMLLAPILAVLSLVVKLTSPGPVLFRQTRVGRDGTRFTMVKFRTMAVGADSSRARLQALNETDGLFKIADDPRLTSVGGALRRSSLDELPQLLNVLRGDMSLVGPRPLVVDEDAKVEGWHRRRLHLKPGMTGAWQIMGHARVPLREMVSMDYLYIVNWSVWSDVRILLQTVGHVVGRRGL